jgi:adenylate cyclase
MRCTLKACADMVEERVQRRLSAILAADVVGYSRLMEQDEADTFQRVRADRKDLFEPEIERQHGHIFKLMGDGLLAEFGSVVDAVECAAALQQSLGERNASLPQERRIQVRIGINLGEVIVEDEDRYGEGVIVAARLQELAEPGGICVSGKVAKEVEKKLSFGFQSIGEQQVKNIAEPVSVYRVVRDGAVRGRQRRRGLSTTGLRRAVAAAVVLVVLVAAASVGAYYFHQRQLEPSGPASIAMLPFVNMSGDSSENYLGEGVAEDIITVLSTFPVIHVVSRTSSFVYDKPVKVQQVAQDLDVRYVLEGSVRKEGDKIRVTAQLIDAAKGDHVWADRFDGEADNVFALQEEVADKVYETIGGLKGEIVKTEESSAWRKSAPSLDEYDYYMRGHSLFLRDPLTEELNARARQIWEEGLAKFPDSALLRIKICFTYQVSLNNGWGKDPGGDLERAWKLGTEAQAMENKSRLETWLGHWVMAFLY